MNDPGTCRSCGAPVVWSEHARTGKRAPLQVDPTGTFVIPAGEGYRSIRTEDVRAGRARYSNHYSTCPEAEAWRRRKGGGR